MVRRHETVLLLRSILMLRECNFQANYDRLFRVIRQTTTDGLITLIIISSIGRSLLAAGE